MMEDKAHNELVGDLRELYIEAEEYEFHDFKNRKYPSPKVDLVLKLNNIIEKVKHGEYDNRPLDTDKGSDRI